jgi:signal transduction histidine kinase
LSLAIDDVNQGSPSLHESLQRTGRELWSPPTPDDAARFKWGQVLEAGIRRNPLPTLLVLLIWIPAAVMSFASFLDWPETVLRVITAAGAIAVVFELGRRWIALRGSSTTGVLITTLAVSWVVTSPVSWWLWSDRSLDLAIPTMVSNAVWLTLITVLSGMGIAALRSSDAIVRDLRGKVSEAEIQALAANEELAIVRRELAALLHGPVRSRLNTASAVLDGVEGVSRRDVSDELKAALLSLRQVRTGAPATHELLTEVTGVLDPWNPLLDIEVSCPELSSDLAASAVILVEESVANAYRHGQASHVRVLITGHASSIHVVVEDDGIGIDPDAHAGLGTELFEQYAPGQWCRESIPSGGTRIQWTLSRGDSSV